jgi:hypothetical protein
MAAFLGAKLTSAVWLINAPFSTNSRRNEAAEVPVLHAFKLPCWLFLSCPGSAMQIVFIGFVSADVPARENALPSTAG